MRVVLLVGLIVSVCACSPRPENAGDQTATAPSGTPGDKAVADAATTLQGSWYSAGWESLGTKTAGEGLGGTVYTFTDGRYRYERPGAAPQEGTWKITGRNGNVFDLDQTLTAGPNAGLTLTGILEVVDEDTVRLAVPFFNSQPMVRPQKFEAGVSDRHGVFLLKRRK